MSHPLDQTPRSLRLPFAYRRTLYVGAVGSALEVAKSGCRSSAMTQFALAHRESRAYVVKKGIPRVRAPPRYRVVPIVDLIKKP
jgi:hypothetical protein